MYVKLVFKTVAQLQLDMIFCQKAPFIDCDWLELKHF